MILYATKQTIKDLNIPMVDELSQFNRMLAQKIREEQTNDRLLEWGLKIFNFDNRKIKASEQNVVSTRNHKVTSGS